MKIHKKIQFKHYTGLPLYLKTWNFKQKPLKNLEKSEIFKNFHI